MKNFVQPGDTITVPAPYALVPGDGCLAGALFGVSCGAYANAAPDAEIKLTGVYDLTALATDVASGSVLVPAYWDNANRRVTVTAAGNTKIGVIIKAKVNGDATARVRLNASF